MTRREALEFFKEELKDGKCSDTCVICNAKEWAIKALEEPTLTTTTTTGEPIAFFGPIGIGPMWHKYPEEKPPKEDVPYLITCEYLWGEEKFVTEAFWGDVDGTPQWFEIDLQGNDAPIKLKVFAWTEMPEPYKDN